MRGDFQSADGHNESVSLHIERSRFRIRRWATIYEFASIWKRLVQDHMPSDANLDVRSYCSIRARFLLRCAAHLSRANSGPPLEQHDRPPENNIHAASGHAADEGAFSVLFASRVCADELCDLPWRSGQSRRFRDAQSRLASVRCRRESCIFSRPGCGKRVYGSRRATSHGKTARATS